MKKEVTKLSKAKKTKWLKALRSGEFVQGQGYLCASDPYTSNYEHCCLGVACAIGLAKPADGKFLGEAQFVKSSFLSPKIQEKLAKMNDGEDYESVGVGNGKYVKPKSFKQIANWIEKNL